MWSGLVLSARVCGYTERRWVNGVEHCNAQHSIPQYSTVRGEEGGAKRGFPFFFFLREMTVHLHGGKKDSDLLFVMPRDLGPLLDAILPLDCKDCLCVFVLPCAGPKRERLLGLPSPLSPKEGDTLLLDLRPPPAIRIPVLMA